MILKESEIDQDLIRSKLGPAYSEPGKVLTATGSSYYFIKEFTDLDGNNILVWDDSKAIFQRYENGLAAYVNRSNYQRVILLPNSSFKKISLEQKTELHSESDHQGFSSILFIIKKIVNIIFGLPPNTKSRETVLRFRTDNYKGTFITSYSSFTNEAGYFKKIGFGNKLHIQGDE